MTRILHVVDSYAPVLGGIEVFVAELARRQVAAGDDVTVYTISRGEAGGLGDPRIVRSRRGGWPILRYLPERGAWDRDDFDVVHAHLSLVSPFATLVAQRAARAGVPLVLSVHSIWGGRQHLLVRFIGLVAGWRRWRATWTAVSAVAARHVRRVLPTGSEVRVVCNAIDVERWRDDLVARPGGGPVRIASVLRLVRRKRPLPLLAALRRMRAALPDDQAVEVVLVGSGPRETDVRDFLRRHDMEDWVRLTGTLTREEIRELFRTVDLYVAPAHLESFGIAALEARAAGVPVVAMRSGGVGEFVEDGVTGRLCDDDEALAEALAGLVVRDGERSRLASRARETAPDLGWDRALGGFATAYGAASAQAVSRRLARR
ncbi:MAG: glycosyltransferase family 4 protein [Nocardioidaceae bacterium]